MSAWCRKTLVGMQPTCRQVPPRKGSFSTTATFRPHCAARMAATYPPGPLPMITTSYLAKPVLPQKLCCARNGSVHGRMSRTAGKDCGSSRLAHVRFLQRWGLAATLRRGVRVCYDADIVGSWGAALRSRTTGPQDESPCAAIHKQRPYLGSRVRVVAHCGVGALRGLGVGCIILAGRLGIVGNL